MPRQMDLKEIIFALEIANRGLEQEIGLRANHAHGERRKSVAADLWEQYTIVRHAQTDIRAALKKLRVIDEKRVDINAKSDYIERERG
jgi:hypothetical protein